MTEDFLKGWQAAREVAQVTGSVPPYPPGYEPEETAEEAAVPPPPPAPEPPTLTEEVTDGGN